MVIKSIILLYDLFLLGVEKIFMKRRSLYSLLTTVAVFSFVSEAFCGKTDLSNFTESEKFVHFSAKMRKYSSEGNEEKSLKNYNEAKKFLPAFLKEYGQPFFEEAKSDYKEGNFKAAISKFEFLANANYPGSFVPLAIAYMEGINFPGRIKKVTTLLNRASYLFNPMADFLLGNLHTDIGERYLKSKTAPNKEKRANAHFTMAYAAYEKAAKRKFEDAEEKLNDLLTSGKVKVSPNLTVPASPLGNFDRLADETIAQITGYLELPQLLSLGATSPSWYEFVHGEEAAKVKRELSPLLPREDQGFENLPWFLLKRALRLIKEDSENTPSFKDCLQRCPEEKLHALIPTLEVLEIFGPYHKSHYPDKSGDEASRGFIEKAFFTDVFPTDITWFSEKNYKRLMPYPFVLLRQFPEIININCSDTLESQLKYKTCGFNNFVHLTREECTWLSRIIPPKGTISETIESEEDRCFGIMNASHNIISYLVHHKEVEKRFESLQSLYDIIPKTLGWDRFNILGIHIALHLCKIRNNIWNKHLYVDTLSSLFTQFSSEKTSRIKVILNQLSPSQDALEYGKFLKEVKKILESGLASKEKLKLIGVTEEALRKNNRWALNFKLIS